MRLKRYRSSLIWAIVLSLVCTSCKEQVPAPRAGGNSTAAASAHSSDPNAWTHPRSGTRTAERAQMVTTLRRRYGMRDPNILAAMAAVPRHWFMPERVQPAAYADGPQPIGYGQTISQPFIVAFMTEMLGLTPEAKVLEIGTGSGYQAAVLTEFTPHVYTIEIVEPLGQRAMTAFRQRGYTTIRAKIGDGYKGWPEYAPFDAVIVTCAPDHIPEPLVEQLKVGGRIAIPVGSRWGVQELLLVTKQADGTLKHESKMPVRFVPLIREKD